MMHARCLWRLKRPKRENEAITSTCLKRKLHLSMEKEVESDDNVYYEHDAFLVTINCAAKLFETEGNSG
ncbi:hypothetical protein Tco_0962514, partial [Tanacetum coccineum]